MPPSTTERDSSGWSTDWALYACPNCKGKLAPTVHSLHCPVCERIYEIRGEIPDFILEDLTQSPNPVLRKAKSIDRLARIYETRLWYPVVLNLAAGWGRMSLPRLITLIHEMIGTVTGPVLDVACGPGTYGRRVAAPSRKVYGIDISRGMLERGIAYARHEHITDIHFARAQVEALPFGNAVFEGAICSGSLHLFGDTVLALREIGRTLKPGARLALVTFTKGDAGILRSHAILNHAREKGLRVFEIPELKRVLGEAGFENHRPTRYGSLVAFSAQKCRP